MKYPPLATRRLERGRPSKTALACLLMELLLGFSQFTVGCALFVVRGYHMNEILKLTVRHSSTKFFRRAEFFAKNFSSPMHSEPDSPRLSSVKDVTATRGVQRA